MSNRRHLGKVKSVDATPMRYDCIEVYKDFDSKTYRVFIVNGERPVSVGPHSGFQMDTCLNLDLSIEGLRELAALIQGAIDTHEPWPNYDDAAERLRSHTGSAREDGLCQGRARRG